MDELMDRMKMMKRLRLVKHPTTVHGNDECYGSGLPIKKLACVYVHNAIDYGTNPPTPKLGDKRWICPDCERTIEAEEVDESQS